MATASDGTGVTGELQIIIKDENKLSAVRIIHHNNLLTIRVPEFMLPARASLCTLHGSIVQIMEINSEDFFFETSGLMDGVYIVSVFNSTVQDAAKIVVED